MQISTYENLKSSGSAWLGDIPTHWGTKKLKFLATVQPSNVDKKTVEGEEPVILCNYTDVYKNEYIDGRLEFMQASATEAEIKKFKVDVGDVIVTKDSETPDDIAIPACIAEEVEGLVCGYHLTQIKPIELHGRYLFRLFQSKGFNAQFVVSANGVTRFGLPQHAIANAFTPIPPLEEQQTIARFLDFKTAQIDALIKKKKVLLDKLAEKRTALISHAVTKGLDPSVPMRDSGVAWLGKIPVHWAIDRTKWSISSCKNGVWGGDPDGDEDLVCIRVADFDRQFLRVSTEKLTMRSIAEKDRRNRLLNNGDLLLEKSGGGEHQLVGTVVEFNQPFPAVSSNFIARMVANDNSDSRFLVYLHSHLYAGRVNYRSIKQTTGIQNLDSQSYLNESIAYPPLEEQKVIGKFLDDVSARMDVQKELINAVIDRLMEYRSVLVTNAVTGKIDVRGFDILQSAEGIAS